MIEDTREKTSDPEHRSRSPTRVLHGLEVELQSPEEVEEPPLEVTILFFGIVRELLFNVAKHAGTLDATLKVERAPRRSRHHRRG